MQIEGNNLIDDKERNPSQELSFLDKRILAIQKSTKTRFSWWQKLNEKLRLRFKWYYNWRTDPLYAYDNMDDQLMAIQRSTKTLVKPMQPLHNKLRMKSRHYYNWHLRPQAHKIHWTALAVYTLAVVCGIALSITANPAPSKASVTSCTWTNAAGTNFWNNAGNWSCNSVPDSTYNVIFDGAVSNSPIAIDVAATAASFTVKGTNLPTAGDVAYTGTITANQNLTLDTSNGGTGNFYLGASTYVANATTITVPGNWTTTGSAFTYGTSTVNLTGTGGITTTNDAVFDFYNLTAAAAGKTTTFNSANHDIANVLTVGTGTLTGGYLTSLRKTSGTPLIHGGGTISSGLTFYLGVGETINLAGGTYAGGLQCTMTGTINLAGNITTSTLSLGYASTGTCTLDTTSNNYSITTTGNLAVGTNTNIKGVLIANGSNITVGGNLSIGTGSGVNTLNAGSSTINVAGTWTNSDTFTAGTSTVNLTGNSTAHQTITTNAKTFYNLTINNTQATYDRAIISGNLDVNGALTVTDGTLLLSTNNPNVTTAGDVTIGAIATIIAGSGTWTFDGTTNFSDSRTVATGQSLGPTVINGTSVTVTSGTMQVTTLTLTAGNLIQTAGNLNTTSTITTSAGTNWTNNGTGDVTLGGNVTNAGAVSFDGDEASGGSDPISILSSAASARTWTLSGAGTFSFTDVSPVYQTGAAPIATTSSNDGGNNTSWTFATADVISGSLYDGIGGSKITPVKAIHISVNGAAANSVNTDGSGNYTYTLGTPLAANDIVSVFASGDTVKASAITKTSVAGSGINIDLFQNYTAIRHEGTIASLLNSDIATADNVADSDLLVTADGSNVATFTQGVYTINNKTYAPGANTILNTGNWANYGTLTPAANTVTFSAGSGTQTIYASDTNGGTGTGKAFNNLTHSAAGTLQLTSNLDVNGTLTNSSGSLDFNSLNIFLAGTWTPTGGTFTTTGTLTMDGTANQTLTTDGQAFNNLTLNNTGAAASDRITISGNLDINGTLTITDGVLYLTTNNPNVNTSGNVTIAAAGAVTKGTGTWTFDGTSTYTDSEATKSNIGPVVINGTSATLASSMTVDTMTVTSGTLNLGTSGYTLKLANAGATADVLSVSGTLTVGTSTIQYAATNSAGNINILTIPYSSLQFTPISGSESYDMTGNLTSANAMAGNVTIDANATVNTYVGTTSYDISCVNVTVNTSGILNAGTPRSSGTSYFTVSGNWNVYNTTNGFYSGISTVDLTGTGDVRIHNVNNCSFYNLNVAAASQTTTKKSSAFLVTGVMTVGAGTYTDAMGTSTSLGNNTSSESTPLVITPGASITGASISYNGYAATTNIASATYGTLIINLYGNPSTRTANFAGDVTATSLSIYGNEGQNMTVNANDHTINTGTFNLGITSSTNNGVTFNLGSGVINATGNFTIYPTNASFANTLNANTGTINIGGNFTNSDTFTYGTSTVNFNGTTPSTISGTAANTFYNLTSTTPGKTIIFPASATQTIAAGGSLGFTGTSAGMVHLRSSTPGTRFNFSVPANQNVSYVDVKDAAQTNGSYTITDNNGADAGNNDANWIFTGSGPRYWVAPGAGNWNDTANWSASSGGTANASVPTSGNMAIFDQAAGNGSYPCTINAILTVDDIKVASYTNTITANYLTTVNSDIDISTGTINTASAGTLNINGDLLISGTGTFVAPSGNLNIAGNFSNSATFTHSSGYTIFTSTSPTSKTITSGTAHFYNINFNGTGGSWTMADDSTTDNNFTITTGTVLGGATTLNIGGNWTNTTTGIFTYGTSTVNLTGTGSITGISSTISSSFYNLTCAAATKTTTILGVSYNYATIYNTFTTGTGTLTGPSSVMMKASNTTPFVNGGGSITGLGRFAYSADSQTITAGTYSQLDIASASSNNTASLSGDVVATTINLQSGWTDGQTVLNTNDHNITTTTLNLGNVTQSNGTINMGSGALVVNGVTTISTQKGTTYHNVLNLGTGSHTFGGNFVNNDTLTAGTSTANFTSSGTQTLNSGGTGTGKIFYNVTHSGTGTLQLLTNAINIDGAFSQTAGTFNANALSQNFAGDFSLSSGTTYTKGGTLTFDGTTSYSDATATPQNIGTVVLNGTSTTVTSGTMQVDTIALNGGNLIQTAGNIKTTSTITTSASTNWTNNGTGDITLGGNVTNAGTISFDGDEATGGADPISILSTATGRQWEKSGSGTFSFTDVFVSYQTVGATQGTISVTSGSDGGNNTNWLFATNKVISGSLYDGIGGSKITAAKTIAVSVNGAAATTTTSSSGDYTLTLGSNLAANDIVSVFVSGDTVKASAIAKTSIAASGINIDLFQNYTALRHEGTIASLTNTDLDTADNVSDADLLESVTASVPTFTQGIYILSNKTYAPGADCVVQGNFANYGTFTASTYTVTFDGTSTVSGLSTTTFNNVTINNAKTLAGHATNMNITGNFTNSGTFTHNSGTVTFNGTANQTFTDGGQSFNNIVLNNTGTNGSADRIIVSGNLDINGNLTITDGALYLVTNNPTVNIAGNTSIAALGAVTKGSGAWTFDGVTATTYSDLAATSSNLGAVTLNKTDTITPATNNLLTINSNMTTDNLTIDGTAGQEDTLSITSTKTLTTNAWSTTTIQSGATISGAGTLKLNDNSGPNLSTTGTLNSQVQFSISSGNIEIPARTYGGNVTILQGGSSNYTATLGTGAGQTLNFSANLLPTTSSTGTLTIKADTYNPTINITGNYIATKNTGLITTNMGTGNTWTLTGNWDTYEGNAGVVIPGTSTMVMNGSGATYYGAANSGYGSFYNLTVDGTITLSASSANGLYISHALVVNSGKTLTIGSGVVIDIASNSTVTINGTINGTGTLSVRNSVTLSTSGVLDSQVDFWGINEGSSVPARVYGGLVTIKSVISSNTISIFGTGAGQTITFNNGLLIKTQNTGSTTVNATTYNPTIIINGTFTASKASTGINYINMGTGTWTVNGNVDFTNATVVPDASTLTLNADGLKTQTFNSNNQPLYNLTHSGNGTVQLVTNPLTLFGTLTNSAGFFNANNLDINIAGSLNNTATITNTASTNLTLNGDTTGNTIKTNSTSFNNVTINSPYTTGPVGWWKLDDGSGNATDSSGNGYTGTLTGPTHLPTWTSTVKDASYYGGNPYAVSFDGTEDHVDMGDVLDMGTENLTISTWIKHPSTAAYRTIVDKRVNSAGADGYGVWITNAGKLQSNFGAASGTTYASSASSTTVADNNWHHIVVVFDRSGLLQQYIDGMPDGSISINAESGYDVQTANKLVVGRGDNGTQYPNAGIIDDVRIYNRALSAVEMSTLYNGTNPVVGSYQLTDALTANGNLTITAGTLDANGQNMTVGGNWSNSDTFTPGAGTVTFNKSSSTQTLDSGGTGTGKLFNNVTHSGAGNLQLTTNNLNVDGNLVNSAGTLDANDLDITDAGNWDSTGGAFSSYAGGTPTTQTITFDGNASAHQTFTTNAQPFNNIILNNTQATYDQLIVSGNLDINKDLTITDGILKLDTNNPSTTLAGNMSIGASGAVTKGNGTLTFDGLTAATYTDSTAIPQNIGAVVLNKTDVVAPATNDKLTLASSITLDTLDVDGTLLSADTLDLGSLGGFTMTIANAGATANVFTVGTNTVIDSGNSIVKYTATNSGGNINVATVPYNNLQISGAETYDLANNLTSANAITGNLTIDNGATLTSGTNYDIELAGNWTNSGTFTANSGDVILTGVDQSITGSTTFYNLTKADATNNATDRILTIDNASTITIDTGGTFTIDGLDDSDRVNLVSDNPGTPWEFILNGSASINYADVTDSDASGGSEVDASDGTNNDGTGNTHWLFAAAGNTISGSFYDNIGGSKITSAAKTINCSINGGAATTAETSSGDFTVTTSSVLAANDIITIYVSGETEKASTITKVSATGDLTVIDLFQNYTTIRHEGSITNIANTDLATADNLADSDELFSADGSNNVTYTQGLYILTGKTYTPGAGTTATNVNIAGTFTAGSYTHTASGNWTRTGTFTYNTSTVDLTGTGNLSAGSSFYDLHAAADTKTTTITGSGNTNIYHVLTLGTTGVFGGSAKEVRLYGSGTPLVTGGSNITSLYVIYYGNSATTVAAANYAYALGIRGTNGAVFTAGGTILAGQLLIVWGNSGGQTFDTNGQTITTTSGVEIGVNGLNSPTTFKASGSGAITIGGNITNYYGTAGGQNIIDLSTYSGTMSIAGNFVNNDTLTPGTTSTVNFTKASGTQTLNSGGTGTGKDFYNITHSGAGTLQLLTNDIKATGNFLNSGGTFTTTDGTSRNVTVDGNFTINNSSTVTANASTFTVGGSWDHSAGTFTYGTSTVNLTGTGNVNTGGDAKPLYNLTVAANTKTTTLSSDASVNNVLTLANGGTLSIGAYYIRLYKSDGDPLSLNGATISNGVSGGSVIYRPTANISVAGGTFGCNVYYSAKTNSSTITLTSAVDAEAIAIQGVATGIVATLDTGVGNNAVTATSLNVGAWNGTDNFLSGTLNANGSTVTINSNLIVVVTDGANTNTFNAGSSAINITGNFTNNDTFTAGTSTVDFTKSSGTQTLNSGGTGAGKLFNNLTHSGAGTLQLSTNAIDIDGNFTNSAGTFDANGLNVNIAKDWDISGGSFSAGATPGTQTVTFDSTNASTISGSTTFNNLTMDANTDGAKTINFTAGTTQTVSSGKTWTLNGASGKVLTLRSTTPTSAWNFNISAPFTSGTYIDVQDSYSANTNKITPGANVTNSGNNDGWIFNQAPTNDSLTFTNPYSGTTDTAVSDDTTEWNFRALVTDADGPTNIDYVELRFANSADSAQPYDSLKFRWTEATDTFSEEADTQNTATITSTGTDSSSSSNQWTLDFKVKLNSNFLVKDTLYAAELYTVDDAATSDTDNYTNKFQVSDLSISLGVNNATLAFGSLLPGNVLTGTTITTVTTNYPNGYSLSIHDAVTGSDSALLHTDTSTRIADYSGTITTPTLWSGTGLGICVFNATGKDAKWGTGTTETDSNNKYAGVPETSSIIHSKTSSPTSSDQTSIGYKLVVPNAQKTGDYSGIITYTATGVLN